MAGDKRQEEFINCGMMNDGDRSDCGDCDEHVQSSFAANTGEVVSSSSESAGENIERGGSRSGRIGLAGRLTDILVHEGDGDLLLQHSERESNFLQWLQALDMQVMGACRSDERMKPLLKANNSNGIAEDRLLAHLSQHFDTAEVGLLARCLCIPLVSIRAGKVIKQGTMLCPTSSRGNLNVALLPSSDMRISFIGDDGQAERIATFSSMSESTVAIEEISADISGRSFMIKCSDAEVFYFWCAERSKLLGHELLSKMKDLFNRKPTLASLTGISESRLECFATHLRAYLMGSNINNQRSSATILDSISNEVGNCSQSSSSPSKSSRSRHLNGANQQLKSHTVYQGSLSPRSNSFKEGCPRSFRIAAREKLKRRGDSNILQFSVTTPINSTSLTASGMVDTASSSQNPEKNLEHTKNLGSNSGSALSFLESLGNATFPPLRSTESQGPPVALGVSVGGGIGSLFSPYYCLCPPCPALSASFSAHPFPFPSSGESFTPFSSFPPLSSLLPVTRASTLLAEIPPLSLGAEVPTLNFTSPLLSVQGPNQISTFTPLMCDPIVHVPVIDVCSSGPGGYLVSAGPTAALASALPPLIMAEPDSMVEKGARETLRLLIGGSSGSTSQPSPPFIGVLPSEILSNEKTGGLLVTGSRGMYCGNSDVDAVANSFAAVSLASLLCEGSKGGIGVGGDDRGGIEDCRDKPNGPNYWFGSNVDGGSSSGREED